MFVRRIDLGVGARKKEIISTREERIEILLRLEVEAVKRPKFVEQAAPDDEHVFLSHLHRHCHSERSEAKSKNPVAMPIVTPRDVSTSLDMTDGIKTNK